MPKAVTAESPTILSPGSGKSRASLTGSFHFIKGNSWTWPLLIAVVFGAASLIVSRMVERTLKEELQTTLQTVLNADVTALKIWMKQQESTAASLALTPTVQKHVRDVLQLAESGMSPDEMRTNSEVLEFHDEMRPIYETHGFSGFAVLSVDGKVVASSDKLAVGIQIDDEGRGYLTTLLSGKSLMTPPLKSRAPIKNADGEYEVGIQVMFAGAVVKDTDGQPLAALVFRVRPEEDFSRILKVARMGNTGETYAFNERGVMLSESRFTSDLVQVGLLPESEQPSSVLNIELRNPGVNLTAGRRPNQPRQEQPLTHMAQQAISGDDGVNVDGYEDYRGVKVVGAWTWLDDYKFGVATEVDQAEAYSTLSLMRNSVRGMILLLLASSVLIFLYSRANSQMERKMRDALLEAKELGQYKLDHKIGEGGMGVVFKAHHSLLKRPTALKLIQSDRASNESLARFEREVRLTSLLSHPNTISIYDFGRTPEGVFYYAMEYLEGCTLQDLVEAHGPLPANRVVHILKQICGSLNEAHQQGLIHRDIKPQNIMLTKRGGEYDVVKVLDFGLVKVVDSKKEASLTAANAITGTPLYLSPEAINNPQDIDGRSDLYALGAVGYFLLTGTPVFDGESVMAICMHQTNTPPQPPSDRINGSVEPTLEKLLMQCLQKKQRDRPATAFDLGEQLDQIALVEPWTQRTAKEWWAKHEIDPVNLSQVGFLPNPTAETLIASQSELTGFVPVSGDTITPQNQSDTRAT